MRSGCPKCERLQKHDKNKVLVLCWLCLMQLADRENEKQIKESAQWDWQETFKGIYRGEGVNRGVVALKLKITPNMLSRIKTGRYPISPQILDSIEEHYSKYLVESKQNASAGLVKP